MKLSLSDQLKSLFEYFCQVPKYWFLVAFLFLVGGALSAYGVHEYNKVSYESFTQPQGIIILGDKDTIIKDMKIIVMDRIPYKDEEAWRFADIDLVVCCKKMTMILGLPHEIEYVSFINQTKEIQFFYTNWSYDKIKDTSTLAIVYNSSKDENNISILFSWKINEKISYDQERVAINFETPYYGQPLYKQILPLDPRNDSYLPEIDRLTIQINGNHLIDLSLTQPSPTFYYYVDGNPWVYWTFDSKRETSSVQAVFKNPSLAQEESSIIFFSGLYFVIGISAIFLGIGIAIDLLREASKS